MKNRTAARLVLIAVAVALIGVGLVPPLVADGLPDPLATQWSFDGEVSSTMSMGAFLAMVVVFIAPAALALFAVAMTNRKTRPGSRMWVGVLALVAGIVAAVSAMTVAANSGHAAGVDVPGPAVWQIGLVIGAGLLVGVVVSWAVAQFPEAPRQRVDTAPLQVSETSVVAWSRGLTVRWLLVLAAVMGAVGIGLALLAGDPWIGLVMVLSVVPVALLARIEVFADWRGLSVAYGPWGWPRTRIPLDRIEAAEAIDLKPGEWGGWGYRGSLKLFRQAAVVLRAGPGLRVDLTDGRRFAVTVEDPETAAAVLTRELARS